MSATLNLGTDGQWATKENSLLGYNSENGNYKPLPFDFTRASNGTFVNKSGLIETAANGVPRIDFLGNTKGALKLEPQRSNNLLQSNQFDTTWAISSGVTITSEQTISPQGTNNGWKFEKIAAAYKSIGQSYTSSTETTFSIFAKKGTLNIITLFANISGGSNLYQRFDLENGILSTGSGMSSSNIKDYGNGWYRCSSTFTNASVISLDFFADFGETDAGYIYIYGAQAEEGSYATSLINTQGSAVTRVADVCNNGGNEQVINNIEGTIFIDCNFINNSIQVLCCAHDNASNKRIEIWANNDVINGFIGGSSNITVGSSALVNGNHKIALAYKSGDSSFYVDGVLIGSSSNSFTISSLTELSLGFYSGTQLYSKCNTKEVKLYNTRLSNSELAALTS